MSVQKKTVTAIFMVPTLKINKDELIVNGFINAYSKDPNRDMDYGDCIYLLFKPKNFVRFEEFVDGEYERTKQFLDDYDYNDGLVVLVYSLDPSYKRDFDLIRKGKYSKTSEEFQKIFQKMTRVIEGGKYIDKMSLQHKIFSKSEDLRVYWEERINKDFTPDMEIWDGFDLENETLNLERIKEIV
jgi:hypothetical protein